MKDLKAIREMVKARKRKTLLLTLGEIEEIFKSRPIRMLALRVLSAEIFQN